VTGSTYDSGSANIALEVTVADGGEPKPKPDVRDHRGRYAFSPTYRKTL
jgi:hypothetical protein